MVQKVVVVKLKWCMVQCAHDSQTRCIHVSKLRQPQHRQEWSECQRQSAILVQRLRKARRSGTETRLHRSTKRANSICLLRTFQYARHSTHLWCEPPDIGLLAKKKTRPTRNLKRHSCLPSLTMFWKPTKCGHLSRKSGTNAGCGRLCAAELAKSWLS